MLFLRCWIVLSCNLLLTGAWNLSPLDLYPDNYTVIDVSIYYIRAFICIKSTNESVTIPTLIEAIWPENLLPMIVPKIFPSDLSHGKQSSHCNGIIQAVSTDVDDNLLWVIDNGSQYCHPKLIIFDLLNNEEIQRYQFNIRRHSFSSIKVLPTSENDTDFSDRRHLRAFITLEDSDYLIVYSLLERRWWKLRLITNDNMFVVPKDISIITDGQFFVSDKCGHLWTSKLDILRRAKNQSYYQIKVDFIADLLGTSTALTNDANGFLYYYLPRDGAVVRWNSRNPLNAENHDVLFLSSIPVVEIIFGAQGSVWIVRQSPNYIDDHCKRIFFRH